MCVCVCACVRACICIHGNAKPLQKGYPLVFLPTHKSHLDYLLMSFALATMNIKVCSFV